MSKTDSIDQKNELFFIKMINKIEYLARRRDKMENSTPIQAQPEVDIDDTNRLYGDDLTQVVTQTVIASGISDTQIATRRDYLELMSGNPIKFIERFSATGSATREVVESHLGAEDSSKSVKFFIDGENITVPGNRAHLLCFFNDFGVPKNKENLDRFYSVISGAMGTIPCSRHNLTDFNDGNRSRATALLLVINQGDKLSFMIIRGWQILPHIVMRGFQLDVPEEDRTTSMLNYTYSITSLEDKIIRLSSIGDYGAYDLVSFNIKQVGSSSLLEDEDDGSSVSL